MTCALRVKYTPAQAVKSAAYITLLEPSTAVISCIYAQVALDNDLGIQLADFISTCANRYVNKELNVTVF